MKERQDRELERLRRTIAFAKEHLAGEQRFVKLTARLEAIEARCVALQAAQRAAKQLRSTERHDLRSLRGELRERHMKPIAAAGRRLMRFVAGAERAFTVPPKGAPLRQLLAAADGMLKYVTRHARTFTSSGFAKDFAARLHAATRAVRERSSNMGTGLQRGTRATAGLKRELARATDIVTVIGVLLGEGLQRGDTLGEMWRQTSRVVKRQGRPRARRQPAGPPVPDAADDLA